MFGLPSMPKIVILVAVILIVWYGFRYLQRPKEPRAKTNNPSRRQEESNTNSSKAKESESDILETVECKLCHKYFAKEGNKIQDFECKNKDCPFL